MTQTILIVDDEEDIVNALKIYLGSQDYLLLTANNGKEAVEIVKEKQVDLVLMDIMMPVMDGTQATVAIRSICNVPIILITAKSEDSDKVLGLDIGADDYITKPFVPVEVLARVRSQLRRYLRLGGSENADTKLRNGGLDLDDASKTVMLDGEPVDLTPLEYGILKFLMEHTGTVYTSEEIYRNVWKEEPFGNDGIVAVHIRHLREKIEINPSEPRYVKVVWGHGYKMEKQI